MTEYDETNRGKVWKNKKKNPESEDYKETLPDFTGSLNVEGVDYFVDAWKRKEGANPAAPALNFKIKRKDVQRAAPQSISQRAMPKKPDPISSGASGYLRKEDMDDDIPFAPEFR